MREINSLAMFWMPTVMVHLCPRGVLDAGNKKKGKGTGCSGEETHKD